MATGAVVLVVTVTVLLAGVCSALATPATTLPVADGLSSDYHAASCPQLERIVRSTVQAALQREIALAAGLLRILFHDCFPQGCDASLLLTGANSEQQLPPNQSLQQRALQLIEAARANVHAACGPTVSCADITVLATRDAVNLAGGPSYAVPLGRMDSFAPASSGDVFSLPQASSDVSTLLNRFGSKGLGDPADLVALSGAHTVGKAQCGSFSNRFREDDVFARRLAANCSADAGRLQNLDVFTPDAFDNKYYVALMARQGVLTSDQGLANDGRTSWLVKGFADNHWWFFEQFGKSMVKLGNMRGSSGNVGEIRRSCSRRNNGVSLQMKSVLDDGEGLAASA